MDLCNLHRHVSVCRVNIGTFIVENGFVDINV